MGGQRKDVRALNAREIVEVLEGLMALEDKPETQEEAEAQTFAYEAALADARIVIDKLGGPSRESEGRWSTKLILVDSWYAGELAESLAITPSEAVEFFIGEPVKRAEAVAAWALDKVDGDIDGAVHGDRKSRVITYLRKWAQDNKCGMYRRAQPEELASEPDEDPRAMGLNNG